MSEDDDIPQLSAETFAVLQEFYKEQTQKEQLQSCEISEIDENWQLSQFWYSDETANTLSQIALKCVGRNGKIALVSCPSLYKPLKRNAVNCEVTIFEYDQRFAVYSPDFIFYDYNEPLNISKERKSYYDLVIVDPPFLSEECLTKTALTVKFLTENKIILCTGAVMEDFVQKLLNVRTCLFQPLHKNNLANEFRCYANFNLDALT